MADFTSAFPVAITKFAEGADVLAAHAETVVSVCGGTVEEFITAFDIFRQKAERDTALTAIQKDVEGYKVPKSLITKLVKGNDFITKFTVADIKGEDGKVTTAGYKPKLTYLLTYTPAKGKEGEEGYEKESATLKVISGKVATRTSGKGAKKGRISMMNAWKFGFANGDLFKLEKCDGGTKYFAEGSTVGRFVKKGDLTSFLLKTEGDSATINHAKSYDGMTSLHG